ncbi:MAG: DUF1674 domain-containing protein [Pseudomonadales bacterium]|nr:DUF1674 domain-containing protein [Pseudomonadales bacterium]
MVADSGRILRVQQTSSPSRPDAAGIEDQSGGNGQVHNPAGVAKDCQNPSDSTAVREIGGPPGPEPTRFGDWEKNGRCIDF